jgi:hypothetical protein
MSKTELVPASYTVPPEMYDSGVGWNPEPEIKRLLSLSRKADVEPKSALEPGCGIGRLLGALDTTVTKSTVKQLWFVNRNIRSFES